MLIIPRLIPEGHEEYKMWILFPCFIEFTKYIS